MFGCKAFAHVPKEKGLKLDDKASPCIFISYGDEQFGYKLWYSKKKKVSRSRDVVFQENQKLTEPKEPVKSEVGPTFDLLPSSLESSTN